MSSDALDADLADTTTDVPPAAFGGRGADASPARRKVWAATKIIEGCWAWLGGDLDAEQRQRLILAMEAFLDVLRRPYRAERD